MTPSACRRGWSSGCGGPLILVLAYHGTLRVLERLGIGTGWSRIIAAFGYALAPRMLVGLGAISSEIWPMAVAPWILLPLVSRRPRRGASPRPSVGRGDPAARGGQRGGVHRDADPAAVVDPHPDLPRVRLRLLAWWSVRRRPGHRLVARAAAAARPVQPPFLDWIEDARVTTAVASVTEALRGTTQWIATIGGEDNAVWPAGWVILTSRNVILFGLVIVLAGLTGLALARGPWTGFARGGLLIGLLLVTFGHGAGVAGPWSGAQADLLDGVLAPFRNTHKFEPVLRLPLALGIAHGLPLAARWLRRVGASVATARIGAGRPRDHRADRGPGLRGSDPARPVPGGADRLAGRGAVDGGAPRRRPHPHPPRRQRPRTVVG